VKTPKIIPILCIFAFSLIAYVPQTFALDKFYGDLRDQRTQDLRDQQVIDETYLDAKEIELPPKKVDDLDEEFEATIYTEKEIIQSLLAPDLKEKKIDLDFDEVKLSDLFMTIGKAGGINVMIDPDFKSFQIDLHLKQVSIDEAFILIGNAYDLGFKRIGNSLYITAKDKIREENIISRVIKLRNIKAEDAETMIEDLVDTVSSSEEINSIIVQGVPQKIVKVQEVIDEIDIPQPQVLLEAKIVEMNKDSLEELGIDWSDQLTLNYQESNRPTEFDTEEPKAENLLTMHTFQRSPVQLQSIIKMLENQNKAKVLSNPRVTTLNDNPAEIFVGDRIPYTVTTYEGGVATTEVRFEEPGIRLNITPSIIEDDFVVLKVNPEVSYIHSWRGDSDQYPWVKKREATAFVRVEDRKSFVLGGLLNQEDKKNLYKVPMLGDVPLLGNLFSYEKTTVLDTELIITITPTVVSGDY
jgi:type II secretory pathway component GspD/PulD (secretin)